MITYHIYPENDSYPHQLDGYQCSCDPRLEYDENTETVLVIHNSFDGRELVEEANRILKDK